VYIEGRATTARAIRSSRQPWLASPLRFKVVNVTLPLATMSPIIRDDKRLTLTSSVDNRPVRLKNLESVWPISSTKLISAQSNSRIES
jgi:hypothetical protein